MNNATKLLELRALVREALNEGQKLKADAPSRSTGLRRQFKRSHEALTRLEESLAQR
jgi:hypothetical protein